MKKPNKSAFAVLILFLTGITLGIVILLWIIPVVFMHSAWGIFIMAVCAFYGWAIIRKGMKK